VGGKVVRMGFLLAWVAYQSLEDLGALQYNQ
jgi:hypothetical protein